MDYNTTSSSSLNNNSCAIFSSSSSSSEKKKKSVKLSTDPQSVAARERRHRISDRLKILQSLVPGGSKMDTVSMLDEAIHYVKFLKTQIWLHQTMIDFAADNLNHHRQLNEDNKVFLHDYDNPNYGYDYGVGPGDYTMPAPGDGGVGLEAGESMSPPVDGGFSMY